MQYSLDKLIEIYELKAKNIGDLITELGRISNNMHVTKNINCEIEIQKGECELAWQTVAYLKEQLNHKKD